ncbi:MAG: SpoIIE family protein phosphatase [Solirubrobacterales bacterium]|nr:SpoIIE family protein phosphatase [Solirubrobacterales bacterium]
MKSPNHKLWTMIGIGLVVVSSAISIALGQDVRLVSILIVPPLVAGLSTTPRSTALIAALSMAAAIALGAQQVNELFSTAHTLRVAVVAMACALAVQTAVLRERDLRTRRRLALINASRDQLEAASGVEDALASLCRAVVFADFAEFAILDVQLPDGSQIRIVERGEASEQLRVTPRNKPTAASESYQQEVQRGGPLLLRESPDALVEGLFTGEDLGRFKHIHMIIKQVSVGELLAVYFFICPNPRPAWGEAEVTQVASLARAAAQRARSDQLIDRITHAQQELRASRDEVSAIVEGIASGIIAQTPDGKIVYANSVAARMLDWEDSDSMIGVNFADVLERIILRNEEGVPIDASQVPSRRALRGEDHPTELFRYIVKSTGEELWMFVRSTAIFDDSGKPALAIAVIEDNTARKRNELSNTFLAEASKLLSESLDFDSAVNAITRATVPGMSDWCTVELAEPGGKIETIAVAHGDPELESAVERFRTDFPISESDAFGPAHVIQTGQAELYETMDMERIREIYADDARAEAVRGLLPRTSMVAPITVHGKPIGSIMMAISRAGARYSQFDLETAIELGRRAGIALDNARLHTERMRMLSSLQKSLIPAELPQLDGMALYATFRPAERDAEVGGDFYDAFTFADGSSALVIGDVCGKGPEAAALTALARYTIRAAAMDETDPQAILTRLNDALLEQVTDGRFVTVSLTRLSHGYDGLKMETVSAGHPLPLVAGSAPPRAVGEPGTLLGVVPDPDLPKSLDVLLPAESLVLYTDGLSAGQTTDDTLYALELLGGISLNGADDGAQLINLAAIARQSEPNRDDVAILVARAD